MEITNLETVANEPRWNALWLHIGKNGRKPHYDRVRRAYAEPHRAYHTLEHIGYCLTTFDRYWRLANDPDAVELALWLHDAAYIVCERPRGLPSNEALSAALADDLLFPARVSMAFREKVCRLIMATCHDPDGELETRDEQLVADIDWSALSAPWEQYLSNRDKIRREFACYSDCEFRRGRLAWLEKYSRVQQFHLQEFNDRFGAQICHNMATESAMYTE